MTLNREEQEQLSQIARALERDDRTLARKLRNHTMRAGNTFEWLVVATIACGLGMIALGVHWQIPACVALGIVAATVGPVIVGLVLSPRRR